MTGSDLSNQSAGLLGRALVIGFAAAVAVWSTWFITHLPWIGLFESTSIFILLGVWVLAIDFAAAVVGGPSRALTGLVGGAICGLIGLLILGSKLMPEATAAGPVPTAPAGSLPSLALIAPGFVLLGAVLGLVGGLLSGILPQTRHNPTVQRTLALFGAVVSLGVIPLLIVGGLVTSTNSGMAVPDWPNTYGSNMFLYPLGPRSSPDRFLEHAHRLFGSLIGLMSLVLAIWVTLRESRRWVIVLAWLCFLLVCVQGGLGGMRVLLGSAHAAADKPIWAMLHGVLAQLVFALIVALAATLTPLFKSSLSLARHPQHRRFKLFAAGFTHALILQLIFGAMYRHMRSGHALWTHAGFSIIVVVFALLAGFIAIGLSRRAEESEPSPIASNPDLAATLHRIGIGMVVVVTLQFVLGWLAFLIGGEARSAASPVEAIVRTAHQANGAGLIALAALGFVWSRWLFRRATP